jgi:DNA-binding response OmpR family regulator
MTSVLVVEDDEMLAKAVGLDLREQGFTVTVVHSVGEALARLAAQRIDVLLTDLQLGAEDGIDLLESLRRVSPRTRAVLMSSFATARDYQRAIEVGAVRVLCKPFTPVELLQCIRQAVECETGFRGSVHGLSLIDMLQMFNYGRRSVSIDVSGESPGRLHVEGGQIIHVEHEGRVGEAALKSILAMPAGTLSTSALCDVAERSITRDFREVLLDALREMDEDDAAIDTLGEELDRALDLVDSSLGASGHEPAPAASPGRTAHDEVLQRMREIDGYVAACLVLSGTGGVLSYDGSLDLRPVARLSAEVIRHNQKTIHDMGLDDEAEDLLITATHQYHLLRRLHSDVPAFVYLVLDRSLANPALAKMALASAVRCVEL